MTDIKTISWRELTGNKFSKALHPAMLTDKGYASIQKIRRTGDPVPDIFNVIYDKDYVLEFITRRLVKPLSGLGKIGLINMFDDAYNLYEKECLKPHFINHEMD